MAQPWDVIVIGVGSMGASACYQLARRGASVLGLEQMDTAPHELGAHHGHSRMFRLSYFEHADYVPLLRRAFDGWRELEQASGQRLMYTTGGVWAGRPDDPLVAGSLDAARRHGLEHEALSRPQLAERYPQLMIADDWSGLFEPKAGLIVPERAVSACVRLAEEHGARIITGQAVTDVAEDGALMRVATSDAAYSAKHVVFTAGAWTRDIGVPLTVTRQVMGWVRPVHPDRLTPDALPCVALATAPGSVHYGFPLIAPSGPSDPTDADAPALDDPGVPPPGLFKFAHHYQGPTTTPHTVDRQPKPDDADDFLPALQRFLPDAAGEVADVRICLYANSPDGHFIIDRHPRYAPGKTTLACGFSGHGFKFVSVMGEVIADLALDGRTDQPIGFLGLSRFGNTDRA
ncbi:MAG: N-methyl-L-tryptophan oxidase [Planctomycetota bacterium]